MQNTNNPTEYPREALDEIASLETRIQEMQTALDRIPSLETQIEKLKMLVEHYQTLLLMSKRRQFGASSEVNHIDGRQVSLFGEAAPPAPPPEEEEITYTRKKRKGKREEDLSGLPVERKDYELPEGERLCLRCGDTMKDIGVGVRRELKLIPAKVVVLEHAAHAYACPRCGKGGEGAVMKKAKLPPPLLAGSLASPSLVAHITVQKYQNAMPLYRLEKGFAYDGAVVSRQWGSPQNCTVLRGEEEPTKRSGYPVAEG